MEAPSGGVKRHADDDARSESHAHTASENKRRRAHKKVPKQHRVGNFRSYYNYRLGQETDGAVSVENDPRLSVLQREWFSGKRGLDVGCNSGDLTIAIAKTLAPSYILGIDVDPQLIARARSNLKEVMQKLQVEEAFHAIKTTPADDGSDKNEGASKDTDKATEQPASPNDAAGAAAEATGTDGPTRSNGAFDDEMPLSFRLWKPSQPVKDKIPKALGKAAISSEFPYNVVFKREDVVKDSHAGKGYDFITCFSVTKWIHLFHGDDGIKSVFQHFHDLLAPGGRLILEPQPWKSYHKRKFTSEVTSANYVKIELRPKDFPPFLTEHVGFKSCAFLQVCQTSSKGFKRPIYVVEK